MGRQVLMYSCMLQIGHENFIVDWRKIIQGKNYK